MAEGWRKGQASRSSNAHQQARAKVYRNIEWVHFEGAHYRRDIAAGVG